MPATAFNELAALDASTKAKISGFIRDEVGSGGHPDLTRSLISQIRQRPTLALTDRLDRLLRWAVKKQQVVHQTFRLGVELIAHTHSQEMREVLALLSHMEQRKLILRVSIDGVYQVTPDGFIEMERAQQSSTSRNAFIAMWFNASMSDARNNGLMLGVRNAGYVPIVVNNVEHINRIDDEIVSQIRRSKFLVADFTGHRGGVYFEAGFAMGLGMPVLWTCRSDELSELHFDIRQYNCIDWSSPEELATRLQRRIEAVVGIGPASVAN